MRRFLEAVDFKLIPVVLEKKLDDEVARGLADDERSRHLVALIERGGWFAADRFLSWLRRKLDTGSWKGKQREFSGMTLAQLFAATGVEHSVVAADTATTAHDKMVIDEYASLVVHLPAAGYGTTEFDMSDERRQALVDAGRLAMSLYLEARTARAGPPAIPGRGAGGPGQTVADRIAARLLESS